MWLTTDVETQGGDKILHFAGDSDALIVRGLVAIALTLFDGKPAEEIRNLDAEAVFDKLELREHLTAQRSNGLRALVNRIKAEAEAAMAGKASQSIAGR